MSIRQSQSDPSIQDLIDLVVSSLDERYDRTGLAEDIQIYARYLRSHIHHDPATFQERFLKGYTTLLEMLEEN